MDRLVFPLSAIALTYLVMVPLLTLVSRFALQRKRRLSKSWVDFGSQNVFAWLLFPSALPTVWLLSSALHQNEAGATQTGCIHSHIDSSRCLDAQLLLAFLVLGLLGIVAFRAWIERPRIPYTKADPSSAAAQRVAAIVAKDQALAAAGTSVIVAQEAESPVFLEGILWPQIVISVHFLDRSDDDVVHASLLHELAHFNGRDTLRSFLVLMGLSLNPVGYFLRADFERWRCAREGQCDQEAVYSGGQALALAEGIVCAARCQSSLPAMGTPGSEGCKMTRGQRRLLRFLEGCASASVLRLRVAILFEDRRVSPPVTSVGHWVLAAALLGALSLPHIQGQGILEGVHAGAEQFFHGIRPHRIRPPNRPTK